ncbi:MAG TPA: sugar porter family MFS transporter [Rubrobacter sp.]|nr:sugar porter family MFS transporter [Rubrobacter sp.]
MSERAPGRSDTAAARGHSHATRENMLIMLAAAMIGLIYGYDLGSIATALLFLTPDFQLTSFQTSVVTTSVVVGQLIGAFVAGSITNRFGRKNTMIAVAIGYAAFTGLQGIAPNEWFLSGVRFLLGFIIGVSIVTAPAYIAESSPKSIRGSMIVTFQIATVSGICIAYFVGLALAGTESWRLILSLAAIPALIVFFLVLRLPETARGLMMMGRPREEAVEVLRRVDPDMDAEEEADIIERDLSYDEQGSFAELFRGPFRRAGIFVVGLGFLVQITGINAIVYYSPTIVEQVGVKSPTGAILATAIIQLFAVVAVVVSSRVIDRLGRRPILLGGITGMGIASVILVLAFATGPSPVLAIAGILLFTMAFNFGYGAIVWTYASESFPARLRTKGGSAMLTSDLAANIIVGIVFLNALGALGGAWTFGMFAALSVLAFAFVYTLAPETKGRQLEDIRGYWYNGGRWPEEAQGATVGAAEQGRP